MLDRFEHWMSGILEGTSSRLLGGEIQPVQIARRLVAAMEAHPLVAPSGPIAANVYEVHLHPDDYQRFAAFSASLSADLARYLTSGARDRGISFLRPPQVSLVEDANVKRRAIEVQASYSDPPKVPGAQVAGQSSAGTQDLASPHTGPMRPVPPPPSPPPVARIDVQVRAELWLGRNAPGPDLFVLQDPQTTIGRGLTCDLVLTAADVSREHARIRLENGKYTLEDLNSTNGTYLNDRPVQQATLRTGDRISLGGVEMTFRTEKLKQGQWKP